MCFSRIFVFFRKKAEKVSKRKFAGVTAVVESAPIPVVPLVPCDLVVKDTLEPDTFVESTVPEPSQSQPEPVTPVKIDPIITNTMPVDQPLPSVAEVAEELAALIATPTAAPVIEICEYRTPSLRTCEHRFLDVIFTELLFQYRRH